MTRVDLPRAVSGGDLISACLSAAEDMGWTSERKDETSKRYSLGSVHEHEDYKGTQIGIKGRFPGIFGWMRMAPALTIGCLNEEKSRDYFSIHTGGYQGHASEHQIKAYLSRVSEHLGFAQKSEATV